MLPSGVFRRIAAPIVLQDVELGMLELVTALDRDYAHRLAVLSGANTLVVAEGRVIATTLSAEAANGLTPQVLAALAGSRTVTLGDTAIRGAAPVSTREQPSSSRSIPLTPRSHR